MIPQFITVTGKWLTTLMVVVLPGLSSAETFPVPESGPGKELNLIITARQHPYLSQTDFSNRAEDLDALYKLNGYQLLWLDKDTSAKTIADALDVLAKASEQGLDENNYDLALLREKYKSALGLEAESYRETALYDTALSLAMLRFMHDLHYGRINPQGIKFNLRLREKKLVDLPALLKDSIVLNTIPQLTLLVEPKLQQYQKLKVALAHYRSIVKDQPPFQFVSRGKLRLGQHHPQLAELQQFLTDLGDLPADKNAPAPDKKPQYTADLASAVKSFQHRHGIPANGVLGSDTVAALNEPVTTRIRQIELAMERLRWLPEFNAVGRSIIVNIPAYQLWAVDDLDKEVPTITNMRVVVGKALKNQTPVLMATMSYVEFQPFWNVPPNILKDEILPKLIRNPRFLASQNMEIVAGKSNSAKPIAVNSESIEKLRKGIYRVRQRPGNRNSLGKVKFIFPNKDDVYLHDTPSNSLFSRTRRDFSHGCVRVEHPRLLAEFALRDQGKWNPDSIKKAMSSSANQRVDLTAPIPVLFFYTTVFVDHNNNINFPPDIYGHDKVLIEALKKSTDFIRSVYLCLDHDSHPAD